MMGNEASKLHKSLDLTLYLDYLRQLFAQSTSDSESDSESQPIFHEDLNPPSAGQGKPAPTPPNAPNDASPSSGASSKSNFNYTPSSTNSNGEGESSPSVRTTKSTSSGTGNSAFTSENSTDEEDDCSDLDLTPISDLELNNLFLDHKLWKKSPEPSQDFFIIPPDSNKESRDVFPSGSQNSGSLDLQGKDWYRKQKQNMPSLRTKHTLSPSTSSATLRNELRLDFNGKIEDSLEVPEGIIDIENSELNQPGGGTHALIPDVDIGEDGEESQDDNDSLSEYMNMNMTANSALVLDPYFKYESDCTTPNSVTPTPRISTHNIIHKRHSRTSEDGSHYHKHKRISEQRKAKMIENMNIKRRRLYILLCKKEIGKTQRARVNNHKEMLITQRRLALACNKHFKKKAIQSQKAMKESIWRAKRHSREMQAYWKQADRLEREVRKRREKEAEEQRKIDMDLLETKLQQRKINFLITQTEMYAHMLVKTLGDSTIQDEKDILAQLDEEPKSSLDSSEYDSEEMKIQAAINVETAYKIQQNQVQLLDSENVRIKREPSVDFEITQPSMFEGDLKNYQLKGISWLKHLYDQGINGILADDTGLGKTVQSIAFLGYLAEIYGVWGPFLVVAPTSTLLFWQQELTKFVPGLRVAPYWGNPQERKILRQLLRFNGAHTPDTSFHVILTSYQIVVADINYFNRVKWQYLILDEAQAIKNTSSIKWKLLLDFNSRNLLLSGIPIQNTMEELWALLYFIMPTLFDSDFEFSEWFSDDTIEFHPETKSMLDENHLSRLHRILKPFMLRRTKADIEHEFVNKIEILLNCPLTNSQRLRYAALKKKIRVEDLLKLSGSTNFQLVHHATTDLMNLIMQFRRACNHPGLFEGRHVQSSFYMPSVVDTYSIRSGLRHFHLQRKLNLIKSDLNIYNPIRVNSSLTSGPVVNSEFSFTRFIGLSPSELQNIFYDGPLARWNYILDSRRKSEVIFRQRQWTFLEKSHLMGNSDFLLDINFPVSSYNQNDSFVLRNVIFVKYTGSVYAFLQQKIVHNSKAAEHIHQIRKSEELPLGDGKEESSVREESVPKPREPEFRQLFPTEMPSFLTYLCPKVRSRRRLINFSTPINGFSVGSFIKTSVESVLSKLNQSSSLVHVHPQHGWSHLIIPDKHKLVTDSGKLRVLDNLLKDLKAKEHRVLIYSQMTKMIDLLEEYTWFRKWTYLRLDGSTKMADRRKLVADFQARPDIFVFLLSTKAGSSGINLTAADTIIFYDSNFNPAVDELAMHLVHSPGQTKPVTVYRLICKDTIEDRIFQRAREKRQIQPTNDGENFKSDTLKASEIISLLLDDEQLEKRYLQGRSEFKSVTDGITIESSDESKPSSLGFKRKSLPEKVAIFKDAVLKKSRFSDTIEKTTTGSSDIRSLTVNTNSKGGMEREKQMSGDDDLGSEMGEEGYSSNEDDFMGGSDEFGVLDYDTVDGVLCTKSQSNTDSVSDVEDNFRTISRKRFGKGSGSGKRGRPPLRVRMAREIDGDSPFRRGPGRPRIKPIGPANQGFRGIPRRPGRPPLSKKAENLSSTLPLTASQKVFGFYSSLDLDPA